jgi:hypothetical protein
MAAQAILASELEGDQQNAQGRLERRIFRKFSRTIDQRHLEHQVKGG